MIESRKRARMMQPPFQILAISRMLIPQLHSAEPAWISAIPCAYEQIVEAYSASWTSLMNCSRLPGLLDDGPLITFDAATRSSFIDESTRASMAAAIVGIGTARSSATCAVHFPVPFCPALSSTRSEEHTS